MVTISREEYEKLVRQSERVEAVERYIDTHYFQDAKVIVALLGIEEDKKNVQ